MTLVQLKTEYKKITAKQTAESADRVAVDAKIDALADTAIYDNYTARTDHTVAKAYCLTFMSGLTDAQQALAANALNVTKLFNR